MKRFFRNILRRIKMQIIYFSPKLGVYILHFIHYKKIPNLKKPRTVEEKIMWLKLNDYKNNELVKRCADKFAVREYVKECGLEKILVELIGVFNTVEEIPWNLLPKKFALKWNFGNSYNIICTDKEKLNIKEATSRLRKWSDIPAHLRTYEPQYEVEEKKIICERFINPSSGFNYPLDYKIFCFNGKPVCLILYTDRVISDVKDFNYYIFDEKMEPIQYNNNIYIDIHNIIDTETYKRLFEYAEILSKPFPFVRVDFYVDERQIYFGEMTFTPGGIRKIDDLIASGKLSKQFNLPIK